MTWPAAVRRAVLVVLLVVPAGVAAACSGANDIHPVGRPPTASSPVPLSAPGSTTSGPAPSASSAPSSRTGASPAPAPAPTLAAGSSRSYPRHTSVVATTFWVGEIFDPKAADGSQVVSTYDDSWLEHYGGCDGVVLDGDCRTERRTAANNFFPTTMTPKQNPFYLDLPFDDVNDRTAAAERARVVPWAHDPGWSAKLADPKQSIMKNRWVAIRKGTQVCYGQIEDAGPGKYADSAYVFGAHDTRPANRRFNGAGMDVSPALNGCLGFADLNGEDDRVDWWFVDDAAVPPGPWRILVTN